MDKLAERVKAALPALVIDHEELGTALCARVRDELKAVAEPPAAVEVEAQAEAEAKPEIEMEGAAAPPSEEDAGATPDTVFARHEEAQRASLLAEGQRLLRSFQQQHRDKVGLDGRALGDCWAVGLVPKVEKARGKPRGRHVKAKLARGEGALDDQPTEEELYDAEVAAERAEGDSGGDMSADEEEETAALPSAGGAAHAGRAVGAKRRLGATLGLRPAFACTLCNGKPVLSKVAMASHRQGPKSCVRDKACRARVDGAAAPLDGFVGLAPAPVQPPPSSPSMGTKAPVRARSHVTGGRGGTGCGGRGGPGRGRKSAATKAAEKAALAAFLAAKYGSSSRLARDAAVASTAQAEPEAAGTEAEAASAEAADDVEILGERTCEERNEQGYQHAVDLDSEDEAIDGGVATAQELAFDFADMSQSPG